VTFCRERIGIGFRERIGSSLAAAGQHKSRLLTRLSFPTS
jgi:hypothetical protein